jgi:hypothetical protein
MNERRRDQYVSAYQLALIREGLAERPAAIALLQTARREHALEFIQPDLNPQLKRIDADSHPFNVARGRDPGVAEHVHKSIH